MGTRISRGAAWGAVAIGVLAVTGCAPDRNIEVMNESPTDVSVSAGDEDLGDVASDGGMVLLEVTECYDAPVVVTFADGTTVELDESLCPDDRLRIDEGKARITTASATG